MGVLILLDSSAILNDYNFFFDPKQKYVMTSRVFAEMRDLRSRMMVDNAQMLNLLSIMDACPVSQQKMNDFVSSKGFEKLSAADLSLLALAKEMKGRREKIIVISDDYSIQNMCQALKIPFNPVIQGRITETIVFNKSCPACGKRFKRAFKGRTCSNCGSLLKTVRKPQNRQKRNN